MARIRTIKPDFWSDDVITECSLIARLLFIGTWNFADDRGNLDRSAKQIKARVFPVDNIDCEPLIQELIAHGLLIEYSVSSKTYLHISGFDKHQVINRPSNPTCPEYTPALASKQHSVSPHVALTLEGKGKEGRGVYVADEKSAPPPPTKVDLTGVRLLADINQDVAKQYIKLRGKKTLTALALARIKMEAEKAGLSLEQAIVMCCENSWVGFNSEWEAVKGKDKPKEENWFQKAQREGKVL